MTKFKPAFKTALAMVITYGIAMGMDWDKPFWAALSVIFCSLATAGESINAGIDRIKGTAVGAAAALLIVVMFPQDRWLFMTAISLVIAVCSYRMTGATPRKAIWFNVGFNLPIVAILGESSASLAPATFDLVVLRVQQTALGAVVYSLVAMLVWPRLGDTDFVNTMRGIARTQHALFVAYVHRLLGRQDDGELDKSLAGMARQLPLLGGKLEGAAYDSPEVQVLAGAWRRHIANVQSLHMAFERWRFGFSELEGLDLRHYIPGWEQHMTEIETRLQGVERLLSAGPAPPPQALDLPIDEQALGALSHFQRAAVVSCRDRLLAIAGLAADLFDSASGIQRGETRFPDRPPPEARRAPWTVDLDRLSTTVRQSTALWMCFLLVIYVPSVPIAVGLIALANAFAMAFGALPHVPATVLFKPTIIGALLGGFLYMLVMPHLSGFAEFGALLFFVTFAVAYAFSDPRAALARGMLLTMTVIVISAQNQQSYYFQVFSGWLLVGVMFVSVLVVAWHFPISFKAEDRFRAQLRRYLHSAAFLLADLSVESEGRSGPLCRWRRAFHLHELTVLPSRLRTWSTALSPAALGQTAPAQVDKLLNSLQLFSYRMQELLETYPEVMKIDRIDAVRTQGESSRERLCETLDRLAKNPAARGDDSPRDLLAQAEARLARQVEEALDGQDLEREAGQRVYGLLSAYRGFLAVFGDIADGLSKIDWARLREARF